MGYELPPYTIDYRRPYVRFLSVTTTFEESVHVVVHGLLKAIFSACVWFEGSVLNDYGVLLAAGPDYRSTQI